MELRCTMRSEKISVPPLDEDSVSGRWNTKARGDEEARDFLLKIPEFARIAIFTGLSVSKDYFAIRRIR